MRITLLFVSLLFVLQACSSVHYMKMNAIESQNQLIAYNEGRQSVISQKTHFVSLAPYQELILENAKTSFILFVQNLGDGAITVGTDNVSVTFMGTTTKWASKKIIVQSYNDFILEIEAGEAQQRRSATLIAVLNSLNALNAAQSTSTTYNSGTLAGAYNARSYGSYAQQPFSMNTTGNLSGTYSGYSLTKTYDPAKTQELAYVGSPIIWI